MGSHVGKLVDHRGQWNTPHPASVPVVRAARCNLPVVRPWMQSVCVSGWLIIDSMNGKGEASQAVPLRRCRRGVLSQSRRVLRMPPENLRQPSQRLLWERTYVAASRVRQGTWFLGSEPPERLEGEHLLEYRSPLRTVSHEHAFLGRSIRESLSRAFRTASLKLVPTGESIRFPVRLVRQ